jgi:hypothetical protein
MLENASRRLRSRSTTAYSTPPTAEAVPASMSATPHHGGPTPSQSVPARSRPITPSLIITPDMSAETWLGAAGCATGSQTCSGMMPALLANPSARRTKTAFRAGAPSPAAAADQSAKRRLPVQLAISSMPARRQASPAWVITA